MGAPRRRRWAGRRGRRWGLRRRLTFNFVVVALAAVALTTWLTLGAVFRAQRELFTPAVPPAGERDVPDRWAERDAPAWWRDGPAWWGERSAWRDGGSGPDAAEGAFRGVARTALLAGLLSFLLASFVAGIVTRRLTRPLLALERGARRLAAGERGLRLPPAGTDDELGSLTEAFNALVAGLERQETWRRSMVADIAHDLRTPLSVLRSELEAMQDGVRPLDVAGVARLHHEVLAMSHLVDDLRTLSLAEGGGLDLAVEPVSVAEFARQLLDGFAARAELAGATLELGPVPSDLEARFDRARVARVLGNLLDNSLRHAAPGVVELGVAARGRELRFSVRDHGPGLPAGDPERLFERFYRGDPARTRGEKGGSGLGLSIARALTEAHGGRLVAADHPGGGAVFTVILPEAVPAPAPPTGGP